MTLPPGQYPIDGFPRFGTHLHRPPPAVPVDPVIEISGAVGKSFAPETVQNVFRLGAPRSGERS